jgi:hypothetical protein
VRNEYSIIKVLVFVSTVTIILSLTYITHEGRAISSTSNSGSLTEAVQLEQKGRFTMMTRRTTKIIIYGYLLRQFRGIKETFRCYYITIFRELGTIVGFEHNTKYAQPLIDGKMHEVQNPSSQEDTKAAMSIADELSKLAKLKEQGVIIEDEFSQMKSNLMKRM